MTNREDVALNGTGGGFGGFGSGGLLEGLILGELLRNGFGGRGRDDGRESDYNTLFKEISDNRYESAKNAWEVSNNQTRENFGLQKDVLSGNYGLDKSILSQGFETQLRDLQNKMDTDKQLDAIRCLSEKSILTTVAENEKTRAYIDIKYKDEEIARLRGQVAGYRDAEDRAFTAEQGRLTRAYVTQLGDAAKTFAAGVAPGTPFPWDIPVV